MLINVKDRKVKMNRELNTLKQPVESRIVEEREG